MRFRLFYNNVYFAASGVTRPCKSIHDTAYDRPAVRKQLSPTPFSPLMWAAPDLQAAARQNMAQGMAGGNPLVQGLGQYGRQDTAQQGTIASLLAAPGGFPQNQGEPRICPELIYGVVSLWPWLC